MEASLEPVTRCSFKSFRAESWQQPLTKRRLLVPQERIVWNDAFRIMTQGQERLGGWRNGCSFFFFLNPWGALFYTDSWG